MSKTPSNLDIEALWNDNNSGTPQPPIEGELVGWEYRWKDTSPYTATSGQWTEWKRVEARSQLSTIDDAVQEFREYIAAGYAYELRPLYTGPVPALLSNDVTEDATRFRELFRMTAFLGTHIGEAYQTAMEAEMTNVFEEADRDFAKITINQYRRLVDAGFAAARIAQENKDRK